MTMQSKPPSAYTRADLVAFCCLVREGGQVRGPRLEERVSRARKLVLLRDGASVVGTAAIKVPSAGYKEKVFRCAGVPEVENEYSLELGYVVVAETHQGKGLSPDLVDAARQGFASSPLFATSRVEKTRMHRTLRRFSFEQIGNAYES